MHKIIAMMKQEIMALKEQIKELNNKAEIISSQ